MSDFPTGPIRGFDPQWAFSEILSRIKQHPPSLIKLDFEPHLRSFLSDPTIASMLSKSKAPANMLAPPHSAEFSEIRNTLSSLSEAISTLQKKTNHPAKSLQTAAATKAPNHSLVISLNGAIPEGNRQRPEAICEALNSGISKIAGYAPMQFVAARWTAKGNLVLTAGPSTPLHFLCQNTTNISKLVAQTLQLPLLSPPIVRTNTKWSKILINGVPTGKSDSRAPHTPEECHTALAAHNPAYANLSITHKPSWVHSPTSYMSGAISSLSVAFEDPDGSKLKTLLAERYLYLFGNRATIKKWKHANVKPNKSYADQPMPKANTNYTTPTQSRAQPEAQPEPPHPAGDSVLPLDSPFRSITNFAPAPDSPFQLPSNQSTPTLPPAQRRPQYPAEQSTPTPRSDHPPLDTPDSRKSKVPDPGRLRPRKAKGG